MGVGAASGGRACSGRYPVVRSASPPPIAIGWLAVMILDRPGDLAECLPDLGHVLSAGRLFCQLSGLPPTVFVTRPASLRSPS